MFCTIIFSTFCWLYVENGPSPEICTKSNSSQIVIIHQFTANIVTTLACSHQSSRLPTWRNANSRKWRRSIDPSSPEITSWPSIKPYYPTVTIPLDTAESRNHITLQRWSGIKKLAATSVSV